MNRFLLPGLLAVGLVVAGLFFLLRAAWAENGRLEGRLAAADAVIAQRERDARENARVVALLADRLRDTETKVITVTERIHAAPITRECAQSPAMRAASDGVRALLRGGEARDRAQPAASVR